MQCVVSQTLARYSSSEGEDGNMASLTSREIPSRKVSGTLQCVVQCINTHYDLDIAVVRGEPEEGPIQLIEGNAIQTGDKLVQDIQRERTRT